MKESTFNLCKFGMLSINMNHDIGLFSLKNSYVMIHVIKHNMDPNSNINYRRKIPPIELEANRGLKSSVVEFEGAEVIWCRCLTLISFHVATLFCWSAKNVFILFNYF